MYNSQRYLMKLCQSNNKEFENYQRSARKTILSPSFFIDEGKVYKNRTFIYATSSFKDRTFKSMSKTPLVLYLYLPGFQNASRQFSISTF